MKNFINFSKVTSFITGIILFLSFQSVFAEELTTFGSMAESLTVGAGVLTGVMHAACFTMATVFFVMSFCTYRAHRSNPKFVPLDRPIMYLVFCIVLVAIPFFGKLFLEPKDFDFQTNQETRASILYQQNIDAPLQRGQ